jgi:uncharacterized protein YifN (PemK superfamily)
MKIPKPEAGLVIRYSYLWHQESMKGHDEGLKDRPCAVVLASKDDRVIVAPITHTPPASGVTAIELPNQIKKQLGLDHERSWVVTNDVNVFQWLGHDVRPAKGDSWEFGRLPPNITKTLTLKVQENARARSLKQVSRDEAPPKKNWGKKPEKPSKPKPPPPPSKDRDRSR